MFKYRLNVFTDFVFLTKTQYPGDHYLYRADDIPPVYGRRRAALPASAKRATLKFLFSLQVCTKRGVFFLIAHRGRAN